MEKKIDMNAHKYNILRNHLIFSEWKDKVKIIVDLLGFMPEIIVFPLNCIYIENKNNIVKIFPENIVWEKK